MSGRVFEGPRGVHFGHEGAVMVVRSGRDAIGSSIECCFGIKVIDPDDIHTLSVGYVEHGTICTPVDGF
jgi:hypothetical protein